MILQIVHDLKMFSFFLSTFIRKYNTFSCFTRVNQTMHVSCFRESLLIPGSAGKLLRHWYIQTGFTRSRDFRRSFATWAR